MNSEIFRGTTVALVTPFDKNKNIDFAALKKLLDWQIEQGTDMILICGTTGESATLFHEEYPSIMETAIDHVNDRVPVLCGAGTNNTEDAITLTKHANKAGADGILTVCPYYNKPTQEGLYQHFEAVAAATDLPVILYNVPGRTGVNMAAQTTLRLAEIPNIVGIKEASGNLAQIMEIISKRPKDFLVISGDDSITLPLLSLGADGIISVVANETPALLHEMVHSAFHGDWIRARELHFRLLPLMEINFIESNPIPVKTALAMMGMIEESFRLPLVQMQPQNKEKLRAILQGMKLI
jgi:4-hydroxy-tetrahydrodipicolinate synthase